MNMSENQFELSSLERYKHFLITVTDTNQLWTLIDENGSFALFEVNNTTVFSLWPDEASIESNLTPDWTDYISFKINMDELEETILPIIRQNNYFINIFPLDSRTGHIVTLNEFVTDLNSNFTNNAI